MLRIKVTLKMTYASYNFFDIPAIPRSLAAGLFISTPLLFTGAWHCNVAL